MKDKILLIDDDSGVTSVFKKQFDADYAIDTAGSPADGMDRISERGPYAVIIADMRMPGSNGIEFLEKVKKTAPFSVRIMLTGNADLDVAIDAINRGSIFQFLTKPCRRTHMEHILRLSVKKYREDTRLRDESYTDPLTGLLNRRFFDAQLGREFNAARRYSRIFSIVFIDLNDFKHINDAFGHEQGDRALVLVADVLRDTCRKSDTVARYGGDEFVIMAGQDRTGALTLVQRLKKETALRAALLPGAAGEGAPKVSIAAGIAVYPFESDSVAGLLELADREMYKDKKLEKEKGNMSMKNKTGGIL